MQPKMYISLPMTGRDPTVVSAEADSAAKMIETCGFEPVNPVRIDGIRTCPHGCEDYRATLLRDLSLIRQCDGIFFCDGWRRSLGCLVEHAFARSSATDRVFLPLEISSEWFVEHGRHGALHRPAGIRFFYFVSGNMNSWEQDYAGRLAADPTVAWYAYEPIRLRLAKKTGYTPDFIVVRSTGAIETHEVKGFWRDDARVKIKVAAELFPWARFVVVTRRGKVFYKKVLCQPAQRNV